MDRRRFVQIAGAAATLSTGCGWALTSKTEATGWHSFEVTTTIAVAHPVGATRIWVPEPLAESTPFQQHVGTTVHCDGGAWKASQQRQKTLAVVQADFPAGARPELRVTSRVKTRDWTVLQGGSGEPVQDVSARPEALQQWLEPTRYVPTDGIVRATATEITRGSRTDEEKARAIYSWVVANTYRRASVRGCGTGDIRAMLASGDLGGKCADLNALFVGLARAAGLPARDVYGIRVGASRRGYGSLGPKSEVVTKAQHCRAEVWLAQYGWVPVDPADVRKVMLDEAPGGLAADDVKVAAARQGLFGAWEMNWVALNYAQDVSLPGSSGPPLHFFMYPQAETAEGRLDCLDPEAFQYGITVKEFVAG